MQINEIINKIIDKMESTHLLIVILAFIAYNIIILFRKDHALTIIENTVNTLENIVNTTLNNINDNIHELISIMKNSVK